MTKLNKTNLGVAGDGTSLIVVNDTGKWGAPSGANHFRFVSTGNYQNILDNVQQLYKGPFVYGTCYSYGCLGAGYYADTFDADDPAWKFQGTTDSCEGATNDGQVPGPTLGSKFFWKFWLTDQNLLDNVANGAWDPEWYVELLDPNEVQISTFFNPDQTYKVSEVTLLDESDAHGTVADGERSIGVYVDETRVWWRDPLNRNWGVFNTSADEPKLTARIWQKLPFMTSVEDAKTFWSNVPSHEETIYLRDAVFPHLCEVRKGSVSGPVETGFESLQMGETYYMKHRYFGPARYNNASFKVATSIFIEPGGLNTQPMMDRFWMTTSGNFGLTFVPGTTHHWEWDTSNHSTLYNELGASAIGSHESWVVPLTEDGTWPPDYYYDAFNLPHFYIGGGPIDPNTNQYQEQVRPYGDNKQYFEPYYGQVYNSNRKLQVIVPKEFEITNNADGTKIFSEGTPSQFKIRMAHIPPDDDGRFWISFQNYVTPGSFGTEDIDWDNTVLVDISTNTAGMSGTNMYLFDSDKQLVNDMYEWISPQITFLEDFEFEESVGDNGSQEITAGLYINGSYLISDTYDITSLDIQQNLWLTQEVDLGKTMPVAAWGRAAGDPVKSVYLLAGLDNFIKYWYTGFDQPWWDNHNASYPGLEEPLIKDRSIKWSIRPANGDLPTQDYTLKEGVLPSLYYEHGLDLYRAVFNSYTNNPNYALVNTKTQYDWLSTDGNDLYLVASTGATDEIIDVWLIEPLYPELGGSVGTSSSTTDPATIPVIDENVASVSQRPRLELTMKTKDGDLPSYNVRELFYQPAFSNINIDNVRAYINVGSETTQADQNDFDFIEALSDYASWQPSGGPYYWTRFNYYPWTSTNTKLVFELSDITDDDAIEGRQVVTLDLGIGRTVLGNHLSAPVDFNGTVLDRKRFTLNDDYLYSNIVTSFTRITSTSDYGGAWPHTGQAAPDLNYPQQDEIADNWCYKGQGMKMTLDMSSAEIPVGTTVRFKFEPPATTNPPAPGWTQASGFFYKEFEKTSSTDTFTEVIRPDICGTSSHQQSYFDYLFEIASSQLSLSGSTTVSNGHWWFADQDQFDSEVRLREYVAAESGEMVEESSLPHEITEDDMNADTWNEFYTTFCFRDMILGIGNTGVFESHGTSGLPCFIVFEDISHQPSDPEYKTITLDITKGGGGTLATIDGKSGLLTEVKQGTEYDNDGAWIWNPTSSAIAYFATAYGKIFPDSDFLDSTIRATVYLGVDATTTNLTNALLTRSVNIVTASESAPFAAYVLNDNAPWLFTESKTLRIINNTAAAKNFYVCFVDHVDNLVSNYAPKTITVSANSTVDHVITLDDAVRKNNEGSYSGGNCLVAVFDVMPQLNIPPNALTRYAVENAMLLDGANLVYSKEILFQSGWFSWEIEPAVMRSPAVDGGTSLSAGRIWFPSLHTSNTTNIYFNTGYNFGQLTMKFDLNFFQETALAPMSASYDIFKQRYAFSIPESWSNSIIWNIINPYLGEYVTDANTFIQVEQAGIISTSFPDMTPGATVLDEYSDNINGETNNSGEISAGSTYYYSVLARNISQAPGLNGSGRMRSVLNTTGNITTSMTFPKEHILPWTSTIYPGETQSNDSGIGLEFYDQYVVALDSNFEVISADVGASFYVSLESWNHNTSQWETFYNFAPTTVIAPPSTGGGTVPTHVWGQFRHSGSAEGGNAVGFNQGTSLYVPFDSGVLTKSPTGDRYIVGMYSLRDWNPNDAAHNFAIRLADNTWKVISTTVDVGADIAFTAFCMGTMVYGICNEAIKVDAQNRMEVQLRPTGTNDGTYYGGVQLAIHVIDKVTSAPVVQNEVTLGGASNDLIEQSIQWGINESAEPAHARALRMYVGTSSNPFERPTVTFPSSDWRTSVDGPGNAVRNWWDHGTTEYGSLGWLWDDNLDNRTDSFTTGGNRERDTQYASILFK